MCISEERFPRIISGVSMEQIFKDARSRGHFTDWSRSSDIYKVFVRDKVKELCSKRKGKPYVLVKISACLIGYAYDKFKPDKSGNFPELDFAVDLVNVMAKHLNGENIDYGSLN